MTLTDKFAKLTAEQREKFGAVKSAGELDAFLAENNLTLTGEEKMQVLEYINTGVLPLSDDDLDNVAGGTSISKDEHRHRCKDCNKRFFQSGTNIICPHCGWKKPADVENIMVLPAHLQPGNTAMV